MAPSGDDQQNYFDSKKMLLHKIPLINDDNFNWEPNLSFLLSFEHESHCQKMFVLITKHDIEKMVIFIFATYLKEIRCCRNTDSVLTLKFLFSQMHLSSLPHCALVPKTFQEQQQQRQLSHGTLRAISTFYLTFLQCA